MGAIEGGYQAMVDRLAERIRANGGHVLTSTPVRFVPCSNHRAIGVVLDAGFRPHDTVVATQVRPNLPHMLAPELERALGPDRQRYLGIVCLVARLRTSVSPYYALNITDRRVPLTSVVETTHVVDPEVGRGPSRLPAEVRQPGLARAGEVQRGHPQRVPRPPEDDVPRIPRGGRDRGPGRARPRRRAGAPGRVRQAGPVRRARARRRVIGPGLSGHRARAGDPRRGRDVATGLEARLPAPQRRLEAA